MAGRAVQYNIRVDVHEVKDLCFRETGAEKELIPNPYVEVTVCGVSKTTNQKSQVVSATFNTSFNFSAFLSAEEFARSYVEIDVYHKYVLVGGLGLQSALIGKYVFSFAYIYSKSQHWIYRQWVALRNFDRLQNAAGMLLTTVGVFGPGDSMPVVDEAVCVVNEEGDRTNQDVSVKLTHYNLSINIFKGQDIPSVVGNFTVNLDPYVSVKHGGAELQTRSLPESNPEWLACLIVPACTPCFDGNVLVELRNGQPTATASSTLMGTVVLDFWQLLRSEIQPRWLNFYWRPPTEGFLAAVTDMMSSPELRLPNTYGGRILLSASATKVQTPLPMGIRPARPLPEPPSQEYVWWVDVYEITGGGSSYVAQRLRAELAFGPHLLSTPSLAPNAQGVYLVGDHEGRIPEQRVFLPVDETQVWDLFLYVSAPSVASAAAGLADVTSWFTWGTTPAAAAGTATAGAAQPGQKQHREAEDGGETWNRLAWKRIHFEAKAMQVGKPQWHALSAMDGSGSDYYCTVLIGIECKPVKAAQTRRPRLEYTLARYYFRALIYEGLHLPAVSYNVFPDPYIQIELGNKTVRTTTIRQTLNPSYYEAYEIELTLPENVSLRPDINLEVISESSTILTSDVVLGAVQYPIQKVPLEWKKAPVWLPLHSKKYSRCKAKVLVAFELVPAEKAEDDTYPFFDDIRPSTKDGYIRLFLVGIRMYKPLVQPYVTVSFGRDVDDTATPLWSQQSSAPKTGEGGNWNFLENFSVVVSLPKRIQHHAFLEVKVQDKAEGIAGVSYTDVGLAYITLNPLLPWLEPSERTECLETFRLHMLEEVLIEDAENARRTADGGGGKGGAPAGPVAAEDGASPKRAEALATERTKKTYVPYNDPDAANVKMEEPIDYVAFQRGAAPPSARVSSAASSCDAGVMTAEQKQKRACLLAAPIAGSSAEVKALPAVADTSAAAGSNEGSGQQQPQQKQPEGPTPPPLLPAALSAPYSKPKAQNLRRSPTEGGRRDALAGDVAAGEIFGFSPDALNFMLTVADEEDVEEMMRDEIPYELEADFTLEDLPYLRTPIFQPTDAGVPETVGYLKYICKVFDPAMADKGNAAMDCICEDLTRKYNSTQDLVVRAYVLQARGLVPLSGASDIQTFVWIYNSESNVTLPGGLSHNIRDTGHIRKQGFKPEFNRCYSLACSLPEQSIVQIAIMNMGKLTEECIGRTYIDMEDRFFNKKVEQMVLEETTPIELRTLKNEGSTVSHGTLRGFFEVMRDEYSQLHPPFVLASSEPDDYQLRVVIWRVKAVPLEDNSSISVFVRASYQVEEGNELVKDTDTHYNSKDGTGVYNWRMVFDVKIPAQFPVLKLQIWNYALLTSTEPVGECNLDLTADFFRARKRQQCYRVPKMWVRCSHPAHKGKLRGSIEMEAAVLPLKDAEFAPVGSGRDEPNRDPYLPAVTTNRTYVDWDTIGETVGAATSAIMSGLKWTGIWMVLAGIVALVIFIMFLLK